MKSSEPAVACITTWFHPSGKSVDRLKALLEQCDLVVVVDNTPGSEQPPPLPADVVYLTRGRNLGLAAALNLALTVVPEGCASVLFMDQDSELPPGAVARLARHLIASDVAVAAPFAWDARAGRAVDPRGRTRSIRTPDVVITSGMLARRDALRDAGPFREDFFVDGVDQDMCLRLRRLGWRILQDPSVLLSHELGSLRWRRLAGVPVRTTNHPDWRLYGAARNSAVLLREHARARPRWAAEYVLQLLYWLIGVALWEPPRARRARRFGQGLLDGWRGLPCDWAVLTTQEGRVGRSAGSPTAS